MKRVVKPLFDYVLVEKVTSKPSGILDLDMSMVVDQNMFDIVIHDIGPECKSGIKPGDMVECVAGNLAMHVEMDGGEFYILKEKDVVAVVNLEFSDE
jgi:co-chaperonin GroES (HSP10)